MKPRQSQRPFSRIAIALLLVSAGVVLIGCGRKAGVIFPPAQAALLWPAPPEAARIRYVGSISGQADLKAPVSGLQAMGEGLFGKSPTRSMLSPYAVCTDDGDRLFVTDTNAQVVHVFDLSNRLYAAWQPAKDRRFSQPVGLAWDGHERNLYVSDSVDQRIHVFSDNGTQISLIGQGELTRPAGLAFDPTSRRLFVADTGAHQVVVFAADGHVIKRLGGRGIALGQFNFPTNVALDHHGRLYVSDSLNFRVQQFDADLSPLRQFGKKGDLPGYFSQPKGIATDSRDHLYVVDANFETVQIFNPDGRLLLDFGHEGRGPGEFWLPAGIFIDRADRVWLADTYNRRVQVFDFLKEPTP